MKKYPLLKEIGFRDKASKSIEDVAADKFEDFGVYIGQLYQKFQNKDISNNPGNEIEILPTPSDTTSCTKGTTGMDSGGVSNIPPLKTSNDGNEYRTVFTHTYQQG